MYLISALVGHGESFSPSASGAPTEWTQGTNSPVEPSASKAPWPMRVMIRIETTTYGESVSWTPMCDLSEPSGPIENGTTYIVRPFIAPFEELVHLGPHLVGRAPVVVRPGLLLGLGADEGAVLDAGDV